MWCAHVGCDFLFHKHIAVNAYIDIYLWFWSDNLLRIIDSFLLLIYGQGLAHARGFFLVVYSSLCHVMYIKVLYILRAQRGIVINVTKLS